MQFFRRLRRPADDTVPVIVPAGDRPILGPDNLEQRTPLILLSSDERIAMGARCRDADPVPKVAGAGGVLTGPDGPARAGHA